MRIFRIGTWVVGTSLLSLALIAGNLQAASVEALSVSGAELQEFGSGYTVGWGFTVGSPIAVSSLGWYNTDGSLVHDVGIYDSTGTLLVSASGVGNTPLSTNGFRYQSLASPIDLAAGNYVIGGTTTTAGQYGRASSVATAPQITYTGGLYGVGIPLSFPNNPSDRGISYFGPSFQLSSYTPVPEISINLASNGDLPPAGTSVGAYAAGVVPEGNWNNLPTTAVTDRVLKDSAGSPTGLKISVPTTALGDAGSGANFGANQLGNTAMMRGHNYTSGATPLDLTFTGKVPYSYFDVYAYFNSGAVVDNTQKISILKSDGSSLGLAKNGRETLGVDTAFVLSNGTNNANYVKFTALSSDEIPENFIVQAMGVGGVPETYAYLNGLQFVERAKPVAISLKFGADVETAAPSYGVTSIGSRDKAGVVRVANWNNISTGQLQNSTALIDSDGATAGLTFSTSETFVCPGGAFSAEATVNAPAFTFDAAGNNALMNGYPYHAGATAIDMAFTGKLPYSKFDIYLYYNGGGQFDNTMTFSILDSAGNPLAVPLTQTGKQLGGVASDFALSDGVTAGNYVLFAGLTADSIPENFILRTSGGSTFNYINGLQIVQIPEPGTFALLAAGLLGMVAYAWRKRR